MERTVFHKESFFCPDQLLAVIVSDSGGAGVCSAGLIMESTAWAAHLMSPAVPQIDFAIGLGVERSPAKETGSAS
jgi:hypothetical protein